MPKKKDKRQDYYTKTSSNDESSITDCIASPKKKGMEEKEKEKEMHLLLSLGSRLLVGKRRDCESPEAVGGGVFMAAPVGVGKTLGDVDTRSGRKIGTGKRIKLGLPVSKRGRSERDRDLLHLPWTPVARK